MSRISRGYLPAGRNASAGVASAPVSSALIRRGKALAAGDGDEILDLFSRTRRGYSISSSGESDVLNRMEKKVSVGLAKERRGAAEEFLSVEIGKHDYDWLLTPPGTPLFSSVDSSTDHQLTTTSQRSSSNLRPASLVKTSRLSVPQSENSSHGPRMARSSSTTRASFSTSSRTPSSVLNTSTASVNSRPTTPSNRARTPAATGLRPTASRSTTPARTRPNAITPAVEKPKPAVTSRPSTPTAKTHFPTSMPSSGPNSVQARVSSRPSTPTRRPPPPAANSRPSSPVRSRNPAQPIIPPDFPLDAPPNLRTRLPERAVSAGRQRPGMALTVQGNSNVEVTRSAVSSSRRTQSPAVVRGRIADNQVLSPAVIRGRIADNQSKSKVNGHRDGLKLVENQKPVVPERKPVKLAPGAEIGGYGRTMSKNSLNMALKHMDIRQGMSSGSMRGASLFPHSIRSATATTLKDRPASKPDPPASTHNNSYINDGSSESEEIKSLELESCIPMKAIDIKVYGSSRYDAILLNEDSKSLNWLHSLDEKPDETHLFDHRFHPLPEPFILM